MKANDPNGRPLGTVLRFGAIYGARIKGNYRRLLISLKKGTFIPIGEGHNRRALIYGRDAAQAVLLSIQHPEALGRPLPRISLPLTPVKWVISILESAAYLFGVHLPVGRNAIDKYTEDMAVDSQLIRKQLGFKAKYDLKAALEETICEMKKNGSL